MIISRYPVYIQTTRMTGAKRSACRKSFGTPELAPKKYELRVRRTTPHDKAENVLDEIYLADVNETLLEKLSYPNTALVGVKVRLTDQLSGMPKVTYLNGGKLIWVHGKAVPGAGTDTWHLAPSQNPAWVVWDILTAVRYGGGMPQAKIDFVAFKSWAAYCDEVNLQWNGVIDTEMNVWDASQLVLRCGHAQLVNVGTRYTVVVERPGVPVMMFSVANMVEGSYRETWMGRTDRANEIDVSFFDRLDSYKQRTIKLYDPVALTSGEKQRSSAITLYGVVDYESAYREAQFQLNLNRFVLKTVSFSAPLEAVACSVGDLIYVQHDMTEWAVAGRFEAGSTPSEVKLDRIVTMDAGKQYKILIAHDAAQVGSGTVYNVVGDSLFLTGFSGLDRARRIQIGGRDLRVAGVFDQGGGYGVIVDSAAGITVGSAYTLWNTDIIEEYAVINLPGSYNELTLMSPASFAPTQYGHWMFGESDKVKSIFRIKSITGSQDYTRDITAIQYCPEIYETARYGSNVPVIPPKNGVIGPVRSLSLYEETYVAGSNIVSKVVASWQQSMVGMYAGADVYVKRGEGAFELASSAKMLTSATIDAAKDDKVTVKVVAYDIFGKRSLYEMAPEATYTVIGEVASINVGSVTGVDLTWSGRNCKISWRYNATTHSFEFGSEPTGGDAGSLDPHFKDYEIRVLEEDGKTLRRKEYTTDNSYVYIYDKNFADGLERHLVFEIRMRDKFNNLGKPATIVAHNPAPTVITVDAKPTYDSVTIAYTHSADPDFAGARVWLSRNAADLSNLATADDKVVFTGPDAAILLPKLMFDADYYFRIAAYDAFGMTELNPTATLHFKTTFLDVEAIAEGVLADSVLIPALRDRINLIDSGPLVPGSVNYRLAELEKDAGDMVGNLGLSVNADIKAVRDAVNDPLTGLPATRADIVQINDVSATSTSSAARQLNSLKATVNDPLTGLAAAQSAITQLNNVSATSTSANASNLYSLKATVNNPTTGLAAAQAKITAINDVSATSTSAVAQQLHALKATVNDPSTGLSAAQSAIMQLNNVSSSSTSAAAQSILQLYSRLNGYDTGISMEQKFATSAADVNNLKAKYTVTVDNNGYVSGFGLASQTTNGVPSSEFIVNADSFAVVMPGAPGVKPFTVGMVNGLPKTIIDAGVMGDASIRSAMIGTAEVNTLKLAGNAVTVPASGSTTCSLYMPEDGTVYVTANLWMYETSPSDGGAILAAYSMQIDCSTGESGGYCINHQAHARHTTSTTAYRFTVPAGWNHFAIGAQLTGYGGTFAIQGASIMAIGTMR